VEISRFRNGNCVQTANLGDLGGVVVQSMGGPANHEALIVSHKPEMFGRAKP
jgi:hypothetical protein